MTTFGAPGIAPAETLVERRRIGVTGVLLLDGLCGLSPGESSAHCARTWCGYFDEAQGRCGLLAWDIPGRLGPDALRWFVEHRTTRSIAESPDDLLLARTCSW